MKVLWVFVSVVLVIVGVLFTTNLSFGTNALLLAGICVGYALVAKKG